MFLSEAQRSIAAFLRALEEHCATAGISKYHTENNNGSDHYPNPFNGGFGALMKQKTHTYCGKNVVKSATIIAHFVCSLVSKIGG